jgi:hypothetical protein
MNRLSPDPYAHSVGPWQHLLGDWLRLRIPFALCGMWLGEEPGVEYPGPDGPPCPTCAAQVTIRQWFRLPKAERQWRIARFRAADIALQVNSEAEFNAGIREETETYHELNGRVNDLWPTVPWWWRR